jgi:predicted transcriptional regulator YheO
LSRSPALVKDHLRKQGRYLLGGAVAAGFTVDEDGNLRADRNRKVHKAMMQQLSDEGLSSRAIAARMQDRGLTISHNTVYRCLTDRRKTDVSVSAVL